MAGAVGLEPWARGFGECQAHSTQCHKINEFSMFVFLFADDSPTIKVK